MRIQYCAPSPRFRQSTRISRSISSISRLISNTRWSLCNRPPSSTSQAAQLTIIKSSDLEPTTTKTTKSISSCSNSRYRLHQAPKSKLEAVIEAMNPSKVQTARLGTWRHLSRRKTSSLWRPKSFGWLSVRSAKFCIKNRHRPKTRLLSATRGRDNSRHQGPCSNRRLCSNPHLPLPSMLTSCLIGAVSRS